MGAVGECAEARGRRKADFLMRGPVGAGVMCEGDPVVRAMIDDTEDDLVIFSGNFKWPYSRSLFCILSIKAFHWSDSGTLCPLSSVSLGSEKSRTWMLYD